MNIKRIGLDLAKNVLQIHALEYHERVVVRKSLRRAHMPPYFFNLMPCTIGIEACASSM